MRIRGFFALLLVLPITAASGPILAEGLTVSSGAMGWGVATCGVPG